VELRAPDASAPFFARIAPDPSSGRVVLEQTDRRFREGHIASQSLRESLEMGDDVHWCANILNHQGLGQLGDGLLGNLPRQEEAMAKLRTRWIRKILTQLLGPDVSDELASDVMRNHLSSGMLTLPRVPSAVAGAYTAPTKFTGPGADDTMTVLEVVNQDAQERYGKRLFALEPGNVVRYVGLWEP
jgi:hypothetical protein